LGYVEGKNILIDARWSDDSEARLAQDAADFVRLKVDVIVTHGSRGGRAAKKATTTIPIVVATASDMVSAGLIATLARPGGNVTGTNDQGADVAEKGLEILAEIVPGLPRVAILWNGANSVAGKLAESVRGAASRRSVLVTSLPVTGLDDLDKLLDGASRDRARGVLVIIDAWSLSNRARIIRDAATKNLPAVSVSRLFADVGALVTYGADLPAVYKHSAVFVDKILKGTKPGDIPVEQPTKFELIINLKTAKALGLAIHQSLLLRADHVIQ
jgi:putative ABC transport system substrate-binding protein